MEMEGGLWWEKGIAKDGVKGGKFMGRKKGEG